MLIVSTSPQPHAINKIEDYGMKVAEFIGKGQQVVLATVFALYLGKVFVGQDNTGIVKSEGAFAQAAPEQKRLKIFEPGRQAADIGRQS